MGTDDADEHRSDVASGLHKETARMSAAIHSPRPGRPARRAATRSRPPVLPRRGSTKRQPVLDEDDLAALAGIDRGVAADVAAIERKRELDKARVERRIAEARADTQRARRIGDEGVDRATTWTQRMTEALQAARFAVDAAATPANSERPSDIVRRWKTTGDDARARDELARLHLTLPGPAKPQSAQPSLQDRLDRFAFVMTLHEQAQVDLQTAHAQALSGISVAQGRYERMLSARRDRLAELDTRAREDRIRIEAEAAGQREAIRQRAASRTSG